jgi:SAM-dependent methyltransferase
MTPSGLCKEVQEGPINNENTRDGLQVFDVCPTGSAQPLQIYTVEHGVIMGRPGVIAIQRGTRLVILQESVCHPGKLRLVADQAVSDPACAVGETSLDAASLLDGHWSPNIWHWFMDWLPRAVALESAGFSGIYLVPHGPVYTRSLQLLGVPTERLMPRPLGWINVNRLSFTQCINGHQLDKWPWLVQSMREKMTARLSARTPPSRIYIGRRGAKRRVFNEAQLLNHLEQYKFTIVFMEDYSIDEQIWLASMADVIIGPHGAGMVFSMFMRPGGTLIEFFHARYVNPCMISICDILGLDYRMLVSSVNPLDNFRSDNLIEVNLPVLDTIMRKVMPRLSPDMPSSGVGIDYPPRAAPRAKTDAAIPHGKGKERSMGFFEVMVRTLDERYVIKDKVVYEIGSDPLMISASEMIERGAKLVLATNLRSGHYDPPSRTFVLTLDVREATKSIGPCSVDIVYGVNVLEHLNDLSIALEAIRTILKPGGVFFLHGHPFWTSAAGHLAHYEGYSFGGPSNPLPPWSHLYMRADEMRICLQSQGVPAAGIDSIVTYALESEDLNRMPVRQIDRTFAASGLTIAGVNKTNSDPPDQKTLERIMASQWWDEEEDYSVRQGTWWGYKE